MTRKTRAQKRKDKKRSNDIWGVAIIILIVIAVIAILVLRNSVLKGSESIDEVTNCPASTKEEVVFIIDLTDTLNRTQDSIVREVIRSKVFAADRQTRFSFYLITEDINDFDIYLTICNPGDGSDANEFIANKRRLYEKWEQGFKIHIDDIMHLLTITPEARYSPIIESIKIASVERFFNSKAGRKKLILISDLLQHSTGFTNYRMDYSPESATSNPYLVQNRPYLSNVEVEVLYLFRPSTSSLQTNKHSLLWQRIISESGGYIKNIQVVR